MTSTNNGYIGASITPAADVETRTGTRGVAAVLAPDEAASFLWDGSRPESIRDARLFVPLMLAFLRAPEAIFTSKSLVFGRFIYGPHQVLDIPTRVPLRPLVEFLCPPLGLLAGRETADLLLSEEHYRDYLIAGLFQESSRLDQHLFCLLPSVLTISQGKGISVCEEAQASLPNKRSSASGIAR
jgi:hypothetical protein